MATEVFTYSKKKQLKWCYQNAQAAHIEILAQANGKYVVKDADTGKIINRNTPEGVALSALVMLTCTGIAMYKEVESSV